MIRCPGVNSVLDTRPIFHECDEMNVGICSAVFWLLFLQKELDHRLEWVGYVCE